MRTQTSLFRIELTDRTLNFTVEITRKGENGFQVTLEAWQWVNIVKQALANAGLEATFPKPKNGQALKAIFELHNTTLNGAFKRVWDAFSGPLELTLPQWEFCINDAPLPRLVLIIVSMSNDETVWRVSDHSEQAQEFTPAEWRAYANELSNGQSEESRLLRQKGLRVIVVENIYIDVSLPDGADLELLEIIAKCCP